MSMQSETEPCMLIWSLLETLRSVNISALLRMPLLRRDLPREDASMRPTDVGIVTSSYAVSFAAKVSAIKRTLLTMMTSKPASVCT